MSIVIAQNLWHWISTKHAPTSCHSTEYQIWKVSIQFFSTAGESCESFLPNDYLNVRRDSSSISYAVNNWNTPLLDHFFIVSYMWTDIFDEWLESKIDPTFIMRSFTVDHYQRHLRQISCAKIIHMEGILFWNHTS